MSQPGSQPATQPDDFAAPPSHVAKRAASAGIDEQQLFELLAFSQQNGEGGAEFPPVFGSQGGSFLGLGIGGGPSLGSMPFGGSQAGGSQPGPAPFTVAQDPNKAPVALPLSRGNSFAGGSLEIKDEPMPDAGDELEDAVVADIVASTLKSKRSAAAPSSGPSSPTATPTPATTVAPSALIGSPAKPKAAPKRRGAKKDEKPRLSPFQDAAYQESLGIPATTKLQIVTPSQDEAVALALAKDLMNQLTAISNEQERQIAAFKERQLRFFKAKPDPSQIAIALQDYAALLQTMDLQTTKLATCWSNTVLDQPTLLAWRSISQRIGFQKTRLQLLQEELQRFALDGTIATVSRLVILDQPASHVMFKEKTFEYGYTVMLMTGANEHIDNASDVQALLIIDGVPSTSKLTLDEGSNPLEGASRIASFYKIKINVSTRMILSVLRFGVKIQVGDHIDTLETPTCAPFIIITNESQFVDATVKLISQDVFKSDSASATASSAAVLNSLQLHFISATKQHMEMPQRAMNLYEVLYLKQKYIGDAAQVSRGQAEPMIRYVLHASRDIRFKRHCGTLWNAGFISPLVGRDTIHEVLTRQCLAAFLIRFSETQHGQFVISYVADDAENRVKHYLVKPEEIGSNKSLPDFVRDVPQLIYLLVVDPVTAEVKRVNKDDALGEWYVRRKARAVDGYADTFL